MQRRYGVLNACLLCIALIGAWHDLAAAEDGCDKFAWPLARQRSWFAATEKPTFTTGDSITAIPDGALMLRLRPAEEASFVLPPERKTRAERSFGGVLRLPAPDRAGIYEVTASHDTWIDIVQDGRYARSVGTTARNDCPGLRKSVRFEVHQAPLVLQFSGVSADAITVAIGRVE